MAGAIGAAVIARNRLHLAIQPNQQPIGAAGRPGLADAHGGDAAALQRLQEAAMAGQRRRDPELAAPHPAAWRGDRRLPAERIRSAGCAARTGRARPRHRSAGDRRDGIGRQVGEDQPAASKAARRRARSAGISSFRPRPALRRARSDALGKCQARGQAGLLPGLEVDAPERAAGSAIHQIARPAGGRRPPQSPGRRSACRCRGNSKAVGHLSDLRTDAGQLRFRTLGIPDSDLAVIQPHRGAAARPAGKAGHGHGKFHQRFRRRCCRRPCR